MDQANYDQNQIFNSINQKEVTIEYNLNECNDDCYKYKLNTDSK